MFHEKLGCIDIGSNVFIGANSTVLYDVKIGNNVIVAAGSVVTKDIPDNSVCGGVPARVIGSFDGYVERRISQEEGMQRDNFSTEHITQDAIEAEWMKFYEGRTIKK